MTLKNFNLKGKTALITGAAGLLGLEHSLSLLECDCNVVITDIDSKKLKETQKKLQKEYPNSNIVPNLMDITSENSIIDVSQKLRREEIYIDILINNAALDPKVNKNNLSLSNSRLENFDLEQWNKEISVGLTGAFLCSKVFGKIMAEELNKGLILNIASDLSVIAPDQRLYEKKTTPKNDQPVKPVTYSVIKSGLIGLTKYLSTYWNDKNVRCNALSPGGIFQNQDKYFLEKIKERIPLGRMANKDEYRGAIQFLCSEASSYLNGHNLVIDGGRSVW